MSKRARENMSKSHESLRHAVQPNYAHVDVNTNEIREEFNKLFQRLLDDAPETCKHRENGHVANNAKDAFVRKFAEASDWYIKWRLALDGKPNSCTDDS